MSRSGKIGYALIYNALFLLIIPVLRLFAQDIGLQDALLGLLGLLAMVMLAGGATLIRRNRRLQPKGAGLALIEPFVLWRDRLARGLIAGAMIWFNIYLIVSSSTYSSPRANPQAWVFFSLFALMALGVAWLLILTSPSDIPYSDGGEHSATT